MAGVAGDDPFEDDSDGEEVCSDPFYDDGEGEELCYGPFVDDGEGEELCGAPFDDHVVGFCVSGFSFPDGSDLSDTLEDRESHDDPLPQTLARSFDSDGDLGIILPQLMSALNLSEDTEEEEEQAAGLDGGADGFMLSGFDLEPPPVTDDFLGGLQIVVDTDEGGEEAARGDRSGVGLMPSGFDHGPPPIMRGFVGGFRMLVGADHTDSDSDDADFVEVLAGQVGEAESRVRPLPASRAAVDGLPEATLSEEEASQGCAVCKDSFQPGQRVIRLPCKHYFHGDCIQPWLAIRNTCPVCRYELPTDDAGSGQRHARHVTALVPVVHENASAQAKEIEATDLCRQLDGLKLKNSYLDGFEATDLCRRLDGLKLKNSYLDGFLSHLQNEVKDRLIKEEANLHIYSSNDVDMLVPYPSFTNVHFFYLSQMKRDSLIHQALNRKATWRVI